jgi:hypothetical protein
MAYLVCYSNSIDDHTKAKAIYLDQLFYELIFRCCRDESSGYVLLRQIALLRYKSPTIMIPAEQLSELATELANLQENCGYHPQIEDLKNACNSASNENMGLTISGDMYPELSVSVPSTGRLSFFAMLRSFITRGA